MTHGSLFSGIGGFDLASEWMGWENKFHCEWNDFGQKILKYYWPNAETYGDITTTDFSIWRGRIDILTGGFPCQPYSVAGKRLGKEDERHLWPEMLRAIQEIQPRYIVGENVPGLLNWNGGLVFHEVQTDLESEGYEVQPVILPACGVNAPHKRERVWFIAFKNTYRNGWNGNEWEKESSTREQRNFTARNNERICSDNSETTTPNPPSNGHTDRCTQTIGTDRCSKQRRMQQFEGVCCEQSSSDTESRRCGEVRNKGEQTRTRESNEPLREFCGIHDVTNTNSKRLQERSTNTITRDKEQFSRSNDSEWDNFPTTEPTIRSGNDGFSEKLDNITFLKWRNESIKAYGNAIVPQVVYQIFKAIQQHDTL